MRSAAFLVTVQLLIVVGTAAGQDESVLQGWAPASDPRANLFPQKPGWMGIRGGRSVKERTSHMESQMKRVTMIAALVLSIVSTAIAQERSEPTRDTASAQEAVQQQDQERIHAQISADTTALRRIYADDFLGIGPTGVVRKKGEVIADFTSHALTYQSITTTEVRIRVYGNTAVETGRSTMIGQDRGKTVPRDNRFTRVWVMIDKRWQLVANHYSLMTTP